MEKTDLKTYWNYTDYTKAWNNLNHKAVNELELDFINKFILKKDSAVLDIGIGTGRILENHNSNKYIKSIYGIDISEKMVEICKSKFEGNSKVKELIDLDISKNAISFDTKFDVITLIRVLQYNSNWKEIVTNIKEKMSEDGILIFSILNNNSLNKFNNKGGIDRFRSTPKELQNFLKENNFEILQMTSFSKLPEFIYSISSNQLYLKFIRFVENCFTRLLGPVRFGRILFVAVKIK